MSVETQPLAVRTTIRVRDPRLALPLLLGLGEAAWLSAPTGLTANSNGSVSVSDSLPPILLPMTWWEYASPANGGSLNSLWTTALAAGLALDFGQRESVTSPGSAHRRGDAPPRQK